MHSVEGIASNARKRAAVPAKSRLQYQLVETPADGRAELVHDHKDGQSEDAQAAAMTQPSENPSMNDHGEESFSEALDYVLAYGHADSTTKDPRSSRASMGVRVSFIGTQEDGREQIAGTAKGGLEAIGQPFGRCDYLVQYCS